MISSLHHHFQTDPKAHPTSYPTDNEEGIEASFTLIQCRDKECVALHLHFLYTFSLRGAWTQG
jgi:hypothetical protein